MRQGSGGALVRDGKILLGLRDSDRSYYPNVWDIFGGHIESNESPERALVRELREELGVRAISYELLGVIAEPNAEAYGAGTHHIFAITKWSGTPENKPGEHQKISWFDLEELEQLDLASADYLQLFLKFRRSDPDSAPNSP